MALPKFGRKTFRAAALATAVALSPVAAAANDVQPVKAAGASETPLYDAAQELKDYSVQDGGVGVLLYYKAWDGAPPGAEIGENFVKQFSHFGGNADYRVVEADEPGLSVMFVIRNTPEGPHAAEAAWSMIEKMVERNEFAQKTASQTSSLDLNIGN